jgi:hypothetical protein
MIYKYYSLIINIKEEESKIKYMDVSTFLIIKFDDTLGNDKDRKFIFGNKLDILFVPENGYLVIY